MRGSEKKGCFMLIIAFGPILFILVQSRLVWAELICFILSHSFGYFWANEFCYFCGVSTGFVGRSYLCVFWALNLADPKAHYVTLTNEYVS